MGHFDPFGRRPSFGQSVVKLIGHVIGGAVLFFSLALVSWLLGLGVSALNAIHPFSPGVLQVLHGVERFLLYFDMFLSGMVLLVGAYRFVREISGTRSRHDDF